MGTNHMELNKENILLKYKESLPSTLFGVTNNQKYFLNEQGICEIFILQHLDNT